MPRKPKADPEPNCVPMYYWDDRDSYGEMRGRDEMERVKLSVISVVRTLDNGNLVLEDGSILPREDAQAYAYTTSVAREKFLKLKMDEISKLAAELDLAYLSINYALAFCK